MDWTAVALADLRYSLEVASTAYERFAAYPEIKDGKSFLHELSVERQNDAASIRGAIASADLEQAETTLEQHSAAEMLGLGLSEPTSFASMAYRVQRTENTLGRMTSQLLTLTERRVLQAALGEVRRRIDERRKDVRELRRSAAVHAQQRTTGASAAEQVEGKALTVWFGTNRSIDSYGKFTGERDDKVWHGRCRVFVPAKRQMGSLGSGWLKRLVLGDDRIKLIGTDLLERSSFWSEIRREFQSVHAAERHALVYLHGYCVKFDDAARRTAQIKADLDYRGPTAFFSWPSLGAKHGYAGDVAAIQASERAIRDFLVYFAAESGADAVHIIAHSMGNQGLLRAMDAIARDAALRSRVRFGQIILAAPDVDRELFASLASAYVTLAQRSTLYVSENDRAIDVSARLHRFARAGLAPPVTIVPGIDTINVSKVNLGFLGHSYVAELRAVLGDIHELLMGNTPPARRFGLRQVDSPRGHHWAFAE